MENSKQMPMLLPVASSWTFSPYPCGPFLPNSQHSIIASYILYIKFLCTYFGRQYIYIYISFSYRSDLVPGLSLSMSLLVLSSSDVDAITATFSTQDLQLLMAEVFALVSSKDPSQRRVSMPPRIVIPTLHHTALFMPAHIESKTSTDPKPVFALGGTAVKVVCVPAESDPRGLPATTLVLDEVTGAVKAVVNARNLTALRNAAGLYKTTRFVNNNNDLLQVHFFQQLLSDHPHQKSWSLLVLGNRSGRIWIYLYATTLLFHIVPSSIAVSMRVPTV